jgi:Mrr N-terminal domain
MLLPMEKIEVDKDVFKLLLEHAEPFTDTPNSVLRRLLGIDAGGTARPARIGPEKRGAGRASPGSILPESEYEVPILQELTARGGSGHATEITDAVGRRLEDRLTKLDREKLDSGDVRWRNRVQFTRLTLKQHGLLAGDSPRGIWEITEEGRRYLASREARISAR